MTVPDPTDTQRHPFKLAPAPTGHAPYEYLGSRDQRRKLRAVAAVLRDDLYSRDDDVEGDKENISAVWRSPLNWRVEYGYMDDGERLWVRIYHSITGAVYRETEDGDEYWIERCLP